MADIAAPPYSSGNWMPIRPSAAIFPTSARGKRLGRVPLAHEGADLGLGELADGAAQHLLLLGGTEVHRQECTTQEPGPGLGTRDSGLGESEAQSASSQQPAFSRSPASSAVVLRCHCLLASALLPTGY